MKRFILAGLVLALMVCPAFAAEEWVDLFNGEDLTGWEQKGGDAKYHVEDGAIVGTSVPNTGNSFICSEKTYGEFILEFEFMGHPDLNSGVQVRSNSIKKYKNGQVHGYQCELEDEGQDRDHSCGIYDEGRRGWLYPKKDEKELRKEFSAQGARLWKNGEWNQVRIECKGDIEETRAGIVFGS